MKVPEENRLPPTVNLKVPDEACDLDYLPNKLVGHEVNYAISNGFGGIAHLCCLKSISIIKVTNG